MIYDNVKALCEERNLTIQKLEEQAKLANGTIGRWRDSKPMAESIKKVATVLGVSMEEIMKDSTQVSHPSEEGCG